MILSLEKKVLVPVVLCKDIVIIDKTGRVGHFRCCQYMSNSPSLRGDLVECISHAFCKQTLKAIYSIALFVLQLDSHNRVTWLTFLLIKYPKGSCIRKLHPSNLSATTKILIDVYECITNHFKAVLLLRFFIVTIMCLTGVMFFFFWVCDYFRLSKDTWNGPPWPLILNHLVFHLWGHM